MNYKLLKTALLTSPIFALYGVAPILLISEQIGITYFLVSFAALSIIIFLFWSFNIYLLSKELSTTYRYVLSFAFTFLFHLGNVFVADSWGEISNPVNFLVYVILAAFAINLIILIIINFELIKDEKNMAELKVQQLNITNLIAQKKVLTQQLHPHFLFNALSTLKSLVTYNAAQAQDYVVRLSEFLRYSINIQDKDTVSLKKELQFTKDYISLQKVRFGDALNVEIKIPSSNLSYRVPTFALQLLVENALKHNFLTIDKPLYILIQVKGNQLIVRNNKMPKLSHRSSGIGLNNLNERLMLSLNSELEVIDQVDTFEVRFMLTEDENSNY